METIRATYRRVWVSLRERTNPILSGIRRIGLNEHDFTIISNNCWAGHVYRYYGIPYKTPTVGLYFFTEDYLEFLSNLQMYLDMDLEFIEVTQSKHLESLKRKGQLDTIIGRLGPVEIVFLHYSSRREAQEKWKRRTKRINPHQLFVKMSMQNECSDDDVMTFSRLPYLNKVVFTTKDFPGCQCATVYRQYRNSPEVRNDTTYFNRYFNVRRWLNSASTESQIPDRSVPSALSL